MLKQQIKKLTAGILATVMMVFMPTAVMAEEGQSATSAPETTVEGGTLRNRLNYSRQEAIGEQSQAISSLLTGLQLRGAMTGSELQEAEYTYLTSEGIALRYDTAVKSSHMATVVEGNRLTVTAYAESYVDGNGRTVQWVPVKIRVGAVEKPAVATDDGCYEAVFDQLDSAALHTVTLTWRADLPLDRETIEALINAAYRDAMAMQEAEAKYEKDLAAHEAAMARYRTDMQTYDVKNTAYQEYLKKLAAYTTEWNAYQDYLAKVAAYEKGVASYTAYQAALATYQQQYQSYQALLQSMQMQQEAYNRYQTYLATVQEAGDKLTVIESIFTPDYEGHMMYATLIGDTVETVISRKDELIAGGADGQDVDLAGEATEILQNLLSRYPGYDEEDDDPGRRYQWAWEWYQNHYSEVKENFIQLYSCLYSLYQNPMVRTVLNMQGKLERYCQFVAQLYVISTGLDDATNFDSGWRIQLSQSDWRSVYDLIDDSQLFPDTNDYDPSSVEWPAYMAPVERPVMPTAPQRPVEVQQPIKTWTQELTAPANKPAEVAQPKQPVLSDYTAGEPQKPLATAQLQAVMELVHEGKLTARSWTGGDTMVGVETTLSRSITLSGQPTVTFFDYDGKRIYDAVTVTEGSPVYYEGETPTRAADVQYTYTFSHWADAQGREADFTSITKDTDFYAVYRETRNRYQVTWNLHGESVTEEYEYGSIPSYDKGKKVFSDDTYEYTFTGWSSAIQPVTGNATYTALFRVRALAEAMYAVTYTIGHRQVYRTCAYGEMPAFDDFEKTYIDSNSRYVFIGWDKELAPITEDLQLTARFEKQWLVPAGENGETGAQVSETSQVLRVETDERVVDIAWAMARAKEMGQELSLSMNGVQLTWDAAAVLALAEAKTIRLIPATVEDGIGYRVSVEQMNGSELHSDAELLLEVPLVAALATREKLGAYVDGKSVDFTRTETAIYLRTVAGGMVNILPAYHIEVTSEGSGAVLLLDELAGSDRLAGETVALELYPEQGWQLVSLNVVAEDGSAVSILQDRFVMPTSDVSVVAVFAPISYTVVFMNGSHEISRANYHYGDTVILPAEPTWEGEVAEGACFTFSGWSPAVTPVRENITYTAQFKQATLGDVDQTYRSGRNSNKLLTIFLPIVIGVGVAGGAIGYGIRRARKTCSKSEKNQ